MSVKTSQIRNKIYYDLRQKIFCNELCYRQRLVETQLAEQYGVNKIHIREALHLLQLDGLVIHVPMKGFQVLGITKENMYEIAKIREIMEIAIVEDFLQNASEDEIEKVKLLTQRKIALLKAGLKSEAFKETNATFEKIYESSSYHRMVELLRSYKEYIDLMINKAFDTPDNIEKTIQNSTLLYNVFDLRDCELAKKWIHIRYMNAIDTINQSPMFSNSVNI